MTIIWDDQTRCCLCGRKSEYMGIISTSASGSKDLDTRSPEPARSTLFTRVQRCSYCGFCSSDISKVSHKEEVKSFVMSNKYQYQLKDQVFPELANSFRCQSMIALQVKKFSDAAWSMIHAVWVCDDTGNEESAKKCRLEAVKLIKKVAENGKHFAEQNGVDIAIMVDFLRRAEQFEDASNLIEENQDRIKDDIIRKVITFQEKLISESDTKCYLIKNATK